MDIKYPRNVDRYTTVLGVVRLALAVQIPPIDHEQLIRYALQRGKDAQVTREEILEAWDESPASIARNGFGVEPSTKKSSVPAFPRSDIEHYYCSTQKKVRERAYYAIVTDKRTGGRVYKSDSTFPSRELALHAAAEWARIELSESRPESKEPILDGSPEV